MCLVRLKANNQNRFARQIHIRQITNELSSAPEKGNNAPQR